MSNTSKQKIDAESKPWARNTGKDKSAAKELPSKSSGRDIIISISAIILLLACSIVIVNTVYDSTLNQQTIKYGDGVQIEYVGSLYTYYDRDGSPVIFDTNVMDIANDKSRTFTHGQSENFNNIRDTVIGSGNFLEMFENSIVGHHPGDTIELTIDAADAYPLDSKVGYLKKNHEYSINKVKIFSSDSEFKAFFGVDAPETCFIVKSPYGWDANVVRSFNGLIAVEYIPMNLQDYDSGTGVTYKVTKVSNGKIVFQYDFPYDGRIIQAISPCDEGTIYINEKMSDDEYKYKEERSRNSNIANETLYFTIKIVNIK